MRTSNKVHQEVMPLEKSLMICVFCTLVRLQFVCSGFLKKIVCTGPRAHLALFNFLLIMETWPDMHQPVRLAVACRKRS